MIFQGVRSVIEGRTAPPGWVRTIVNEGDLTQMADTFAAVDIPEGSEPVACALIEVDRGSRWPVSALCFGDQKAVRDVTESAVRIVATYGPFPGERHG